MEWLVKLIVALALLPTFFCLASELFLALVYWISALLVVILPWLFILVAVVSFAAGSGAGLTMRRRLPMRDLRHRVPPGGLAPIRRPRGQGRDDE